MIFIISGRLVFIMKLVTNKDVTVLTGDTKEHLLLQMLIFFECNEYMLDFTNNKFSLLGAEGDIID